MSMNTNEVRCLIAGGAGCLGTNLARRLLDHGAHVDVVDNLSTGRQANVDRLSRHLNFDFIKMDITDPAICRRLQRSRYSHVYNLACPTGVPNIKRLGEQMLMASSAGTLNLLKIARRCKAKYLFASTAEAYGDPDVFPQHETYVGRVDPVGPRSAYEEGKRFGEALTRFWGGKYGVEVRIVRIFNTYGPAMSPKDQRVIPQMLTRLIAGQPVPIYGDGTQTRTFLHVDDLVSGLLIVVDKGVSGEVYNVGGDEQITVRDLFAAVKKATGLAGEAVFRDHFIDDHRGRWPDTTKLQALGWRPSISLEAGIRQSYQDLLRSLGIKQAGAAVGPAHWRDGSAPASGDRSRPASP